MIFYRGNILNRDSSPNLCLLLLLLFLEASLLLDLLPLSFRLLLLLADLLGLSLLKVLLNAVLLSTLLVLLFLELAAESLPRLGAQGLHLMLGTKPADLIVAGGFLSVGSHLGGVVILLLFFRGSGLGGKKSILFTLLNGLDVLLGLSLLAAELIPLGLKNWFGRLGLSSFSLLYYLRLGSNLFPLFRLLYFDMSELSLNQGCLLLGCFLHRVLSELHRLLSGRLPCSCGSLGGLLLFLLSLCPLADLTPPAFLLGQGRMLASDPCLLLDLLSVLLGPPGLILSLMPLAQLIHRDALLLGYVLQLRVLLLVLLLLLLQLLALLLLHQVLEQVLRLLLRLVAITALIALEDLDGFLVF